MLPKKSGRGAPREGAGPVEPGDRLRAAARDEGAARALPDALAEGAGVDLTDYRHIEIDTVAREVLADQPDLRIHAAPDGTVTIMFSDIEGSTQPHSERLGDKGVDMWGCASTTPSSASRSTHGGFEVKSEGDGFMVAFQSAGKALACASAIQKALLARNDSAEEPVKVRMGLHAGEVIKEGEDFFGRNVIMAARLAAGAGGARFCVRRAQGTASGTEGPGANSGRSRTEGFVR